MSAFKKISRLLFLTLRLCCPRGRCKWIEGYCTGSEQSIERSQSTFTLYAMYECKLSAAAVLKCKVDVHGLGFRTANLC